MTYFEFVTPKPRKTQFEDRLAERISFDNCLFIGLILTVLGPFTGNGGGLAGAVEPVDQRDSVRFLPPAVSN